MSGAVENLQVCANDEYKALHPTLFLLIYRVMKIEPFPGVLTAQMVERPYITKTGKQGCNRVKAFVLTDEQEAWFHKWFPEVENTIIAKVSGMSLNVLHRFARKYGLTKKGSIEYKQINKNDHQRSI